MIKEFIKKLIFRKKNREGSYGIRNTFLIAAEMWKSFSNDRLINLSLSAIEESRSVDHNDICLKMKESPKWPNIWPGEHYKLLSGIIKVLSPNLTIEIGTATGYSALAMKKYLTPAQKIITFDIVPWRQTRNCILTEEDFKDGQLQQIIGDISDPLVFKNHSQLFKRANFIFIDAAKDGIQEQLFIDNFKSIQFDSQPIIMFDDIRLSNMVNIWNEIDKPKQDLTSFGHWAGTGLVDWVN